MIKNANNNKNHIFTLLDIGLKKAGTYQWFDESCISDDNTFINFDTQVAIVTHYLHNKGTSFAKTFAKKANRFIDLWADAECTKQHTTNNVVCEPAYQTYLFKDVLMYLFHLLKIQNFLS